MKTIFLVISLMLTSLSFGMDHQPKKLEDSLALRGYYFQDSGLRTSVRENSSRQIERPIGTIIMLPQKTVKKIYQKIELPVSKTKI
jgi:hypothetical protein